jgi:hypothetical protein
MLEPRQAVYDGPQGSQALGRFLSTLPWSAFATLTFRRPMVHSGLRFAWAWAAFIARRCGFARIFAGEEYDGEGERLHVHALVWVPDELSEDLTLWWAWWYERFGRCKVSRMHGEGACYYCAKYCTKEGYGRGEWSIRDFGERGLAGLRGPDARLVRAEVDALLHPPGVVLLRCASGVVVQRPKSRAPRGEGQGGRGATQPPTVPGASLPFFSGFTHAPADSPFPPTPLRSSTTLAFSPPGPPRSGTRSPPGSCAEGVQARGSAWGPGAGEAQVHDSCVHKVIEDFIPRPIARVERAAEGVMMGSGLGRSVEIRSSTSVEDSTQDLDGVVSAAELQGGAGAAGGGSL